MSNESKCPGHNRAECKSCGWPAPAASYTAVDMTTAAAQGFRDGAASVVVELPKRDIFWSTDKQRGYDMAIERAKKAILAAGGTVKE